MQNVVVGHDMDDVPPPFTCTGGLHPEPSKDEAFPDESSIWQEVGDAQATRFGGPLELLDKAESIFTGLDQLLMPLVMTSPCWSTAIQKFGAVQPIVTPREPRASGVL